MPTQHPWSLLLSVCLAIGPLAARADGATGDTAVVAASDADRTAAHARYRQAIVEILRLLDSGQQSASLTLAEVTWTAAEQELGDRDLVALEVLHHLAMVVNEDGDAARSLALNQRVLDRRRELLGPSDQATLESTLQAATALATSGRYREAESLAAEVYRLRLGSLGEQDEATNRVLIELAPIRLRLGMLDEALANYRTAIRIALADGAPPTPENVLVRFNYVYALTLTSQTEEGLQVGEAALKDCIQLHGERHENCLIGLNNLAAAYEFAGQRGRSLALYQRAAELAPLVLRPNHPTALKLQANWLLLRAMGGDAQALAQLQEQLERTQAELGETHQHSLATMHSLASSLAAQGYRERALALFERAGNGRELHYGPDHPETLLTRASWAVALHRLGHLAAAREMLEDVVARQEKARELIGLHDARGQRNWQSGSINPPLYLIEALVAGGEVERAFDVAERLKARQLLERHRQRQIRLETVLPADQAAELKRGHERLNDIDALLSREAEPAQREELRRQRLEAARHLATLLAQARATHPRFAALVEPRSFTGDYAQLVRRGELYVSLLQLEGQRLAIFTANARGERTAWISEPMPEWADMVEAVSTWYQRPARLDQTAYDQDGRRVHVMRWVQGDGRVRWRQTHGAVCTQDQLLEREQFEQQVQRAWRAGVARRVGQGSHQSGPDCAPSQAQQQQGASGRARLVRELMARWPLSLRRQLAQHRALLISPDGPLWALPWDAVLQDAQLDGAKQISLAHNLASAEHQRRAEADKAATTSWLAVGDAAYPAQAALIPSRTPHQLRAPLWTARRGESANHELERLPAWPRLPYTRLEIESASRLFGPSRVTRLEGAQASLANIHQLSAEGRLRSFSHLLFSVHGYFDSSLPGGSGIVLAPDPGMDSEASYLSVGDISTLSLDSRLTILSACHTARGIYAAGEGQMGLTYALQLAGNRQSVATLWSVPDRAAAAFVSEFLRWLSAGETPGAALAATKASFRHSGRAEWRDPSLWAAFVLH